MFIMKNPTKISYTIAIAPMVLAAALLTACSSTTTVEPVSSAAPVSSQAQASTAAPAPSSAPASSAPAPSASAIDTTNLTCTDFDAFAAHMITYLHYTALNLGTNNDAVPTFNDMTSAMNAMNEMAPKCAPDAVAALTDFSTATQNVIATYQPGSDAAVITAMKAALDNAKAAGIVAWKAMGKDVTPWDSALKYYV